MKDQRPLVHVWDPTVVEVKSWNVQTPAGPEHVFHLLFRIYVHHRETSTCHIKTSSGLAVGKMEIPMARILT